MNQPQAEPTRFSLRWLLGMVTLLCVGLGGIASDNGWVIFLTVVVLPLASLLWFRAFNTAGVYALLLLAFALLGPPNVNSRPASLRAQCGNNLKQIALALHNYHAQYGSFPPAYIADEHGKPMHSWRVLILPYLEQEPLYKQYRFDEPWDGPNNARLADKMPEVFRCPSEVEHKASSSRRLEASYLAVVGARTAWPGDQGRRVDEFTDGMSDTLLLVESVHSGIHWLEPRDLHVTQMAPTINAPQGQGICSRHPGGANVAVADGSVTFLSESIAADLLRGLLTADGGEKVELPY